jgi:hypothetical protein
MIVLLSPAKTIQCDLNESIPAASQPIFLQEAEQLIAKLRKLKPLQIEKLMDVSPELAEMNHQRFLQWQPPFHPGNASPAISCFQGEVYRGLDASTWTAPDFEFAQRHLRILSGLYGVLKPLDLMQPYRLEMGLKWAYSSKVPSLYAFWGDRLALNISDECEGVVLNLASVEYSKAVLRPALNARVIHVHFKEEVDGQYKSFMTYAKHARGKMARFVVRQKITSPEGILAFTGLGYQFNESLSTPDEWTFTRPAQSPQ